VDRRTRVWIDSRGARHPTSECSVRSRDPSEVPGDRGPRDGRSTRGSCRARLETPWRRFSPAPSARRDELRLAPTRKKL
jgi:hypothetical protein